MQKPHYGGASAWAKLLIGQDNHMIKQNLRAVNTPRLKFSSFATVDEFLRTNPLPRKLRHLEPSLRKLPNVEMVFDVIIGCLAHDMGEADFTNIIHAVGAMYAQQTQRCAGCFCWKDDFHAVLIGKVERFQAVPVCDNCARRFEAGTETPQMRRNLSSYASGAGEVGK